MHAKSKVGRFYLIGLWSYKLQYLGGLENALRVGKVCLKHPALYLCGKVYLEIQSTTFNLYLYSYLHIITNTSTYFKQQSNCNT